MAEHPLICFSWCSAGQKNCPLQHKEFRDISYQQITWKQKCSQIFPFSRQKTSTDQNGKVKVHTPNCCLWWAFHPKQRCYTCCDSNAAKCAIPWNSLAQSGSISLLLSTWVITCVSEKLASQAWQDQFRALTNKEQNKTLKPLTSLGWFFFSSFFFFWDLTT